MHLKFYIISNCCLVFIELYTVLRLLPDIQNLPTGVVRYSKLSLVLLNPNCRLIFSETELLPEFNELICMGSS
jgi:hypothetical protein